MIHYHIAAVCAAFVYLFCAGGPQVADAADPPATSREYCENLASSYKFPDKIQDETSQTYAVRDITQADKDALLQVLRSQCMLDAEAMATYWDGKTEAERKAFFSNYETIAGVVTADVFGRIFPNRRPEYTWDSFIKSAVAFPYLCGEDGESEDTCKREFATMFAHWWQETSGLTALSEGSCDQGGCSSYLDQTSYFYNGEAAEPTPQPQFQYFGRGPKQLSYNYNYGRFSWRYFHDMRLLENPVLLIDAEYIDQSFVSAFWFYMTPVSQKPSMHEVVTGVWTPNALDQAANIAPGFGATINIINGAIECGSGQDTPGAANRIAFYVGGEAQGQQVEGTLVSLGLNPAEEQNLSCKDQQVFPLGGAGSYALYYNHSPWWQCELAYRENAFTLYDYSPFRTSRYQACRDGLDCCKKVQSRLKRQGGDSPPFELDAFTEWMDPEVSPMIQLLMEVQ